MPDADFIKLGRDGIFFKIERASGIERLDLSEVTSIFERDRNVIIHKKDGSEPALSLTCAAARADALYQFVEWAHPVLKKEIHQIVSGGAELRSPRGAMRAEALGFLLELAAAVLFATFVFHYITVLAALVFVALRARRRLARAARGGDSIQFHAARSGGFSSLTNGKQQMSLEHATFDVGAWGSGLAVVTDGSTHIRIPIGGAPGAFILFAALLDICGSPDDRLVD
ncbi:MAG: hypothetical protein ACKVS6_14210 [Planctomycetota bacterium]